MSEKYALNRHEIREKALQALFPLDFNQDLSKEDAIRAALALDHEDLVSEDGQQFVPAYLDLLVNGVCQYKSEIDEEIQQHLRKNWSLGRIAKVDLMVMRIAIFEMQHVTEVPGKVALNEALELTKRYGDDASRKFVNGVLSAVLNEDVRKEQG